MYEMSQHWFALINKGRPIRCYAILLVCTVLAGLLGQEPFPVATAQTQTITLRSIADWEKLFLGAWPSDDVYYYPKSTADDSSEMYNLAYGIDGNAAMFRATGNTQYLDRVLTYIQNVIKNAKPSYTFTTSQYKDSYLTWVNHSDPDLGNDGKEYPLFESFMWRYVTEVLYAMHEDPAVHGNSYYKPQYDSILAFTEKNIWEKWYTRGTSNLYRSRTHMVSHWAMIGMHLYLLTNDSTKKVQYKAVVDNINYLGMSQWSGASLRKQLMTHPLVSTAYFWSDVWNSYSQPGQDVAHGNAVGNYVAEAATLGMYWTRTDMQKFVSLVTNVLMRSSTSFPYYVDGSGSGDGWFCDGFVKLGRFDANLQKKIEGITVGRGSQLYGNGALNAKFLTGDTNAPSTPTGLVATATSSSQINVAWAASTDVENASAQLVYNVYRNGTKVAITAAGVTSYSDTGLSPATSYSYTVAAVDPAGNTSAASSPASATTLASLKVSIVSPPAGATVSGPAVAVSASVSGNSGTTFVQLKLDGANLGSPVGSPYTVTWNTTTSAGTHTLTATVTDGTGATVTSVPVSVTVNNVVADTTAPSIPAGLTATAVSTSQINLTWTASTDPDNTSSQITYIVYRGGVNIATTAPGATSFSDKGLGPFTVYTYALTASDPAGMTSAQSAAVSASTPALVLTPYTYWKLDDNSGSSAVDASGSSLTVSLLNSPTWLTGTNCAISGCLFFAGTNQYGTARLDLSDTSVITVAFWMKWNNFANDNQLALEFSPNFHNTTGGFMIDPNSSWQSNRFEVSLAGNAGQNSVAFARPGAGAWHHYALVMNKSNPGSSEIVPYVDGVAVPYTVALGADNSDSFGADTLYLMSRGGTTLFGRGSLDDLRIYKRALSSAEIASMATPADTTPPTITAASLTAQTSTAVTITWTTNEAATTQVEYGRSTAYGFSTTLDPTLRTAHSQQITGLACKTVYHYRVKSKDAAGNMSVSPDYTFQTGNSPGCRL
jgi:chitodextrinase